MSDVPEIALPWPWRVVRLLGQGGFADVWLAESAESGDPCAAKRLTIDSPTVRARLATEAEALRALVHSNVVRILRAPEPTGEPVLLLEYVCGPTLADLSVSGHRLTVEEIDAIVRGVLAGVAAAHCLGWVHRDLKPANVLIAVEASELTPKIADFGLAKLLEVAAASGAGTTTRAGIGTRRYMSRAQVLGHDADPRMDVFALGATLYELLERRPAFQEIDAWDACVTRGVPPPFTDVRFPGRMTAAVRAALVGDGLADAQALLAAWADGTAPPVAPFREETLRAARSVAAHLTDDQLSNLGLTDQDDQHLRSCVRCRVRARVLRWAPSAPRGADTPPTAAASTTDTAESGPCSRTGR